jgi:DNA-binding beta-propeller fold protein YncE
VQCTALVALTAAAKAQVALRTNDLVYDQHTRLLFASVPSSAGARGNKVTVINPRTATLGLSVFVGSEPDSLALSDDGSRLHVALAGAPAIVPFDVRTRAPGVQFQLGSYHPGLVGIPVHLQALLIQYPAPALLTNVVRDVVQ